MGAVVTKAALPDLAPRTGFALFRNLGQLLEVPIVETETAFSVTTPNGEIALQVKGDAIDLTLRAANDVRLHALKQVVFARLARLERPVVPKWDHVAVGALPPNLSMAQVETVTRISPHFTRVRVRGQGLQRFGDGGLHFRLLLARHGRAPVWPTIAADGRTVWPEGEDTLHRSVYTTRAFDPAGTWLDFDVFLHQGGRVTEWTYATGPGDPVGLMGPSGSDIPQAPWVGLFGDETALPAVARILAALDARTVGHAFLLLGDLSLGTRQLGNATAAAFSPDGQSIIAGGADHTARLWETVAEKRLDPVLPHQAKLRALAFSPDGRTLLT
ncbi:MAG: SIP domain-containing protein, partial [Sphingomonadales bacterium]|nr:SIP domain-containing protein [Sphingomonadales bacterium]